MSSKTNTLIIGAGVSGLSCAYHLEKAGRKDYLLCEKTADIGGLFGSMQKSGFVYDYAGHLLHLHTDEGKKLLKELLPDNLVKIKRQTEVYCHGHRINFPFQANLYGLAPSVRNECVAGFLRERLKNTVAPDGRFDYWAKSVFGEGICKYFMYPYNAKLWQTPLNKLSAVWCSAFVPVPKTEDIIKGAYFPQKKNYGYNRHFYYPARGGAKALPGALAAKVSNIKLNCEITKINLREKFAETSAGERICFERVVNTSPLKSFIETAQDIAPSARSAARKLKMTSVYCLNFAVKNANPKYHWAYFPDKEIPFYRLGVFSNFSRTMAPAGYSSFYLETAAPFGKKIDKGETEEKIARALVALGVIKKPGDIKNKVWADMSNAYAVYDADREKAVSFILDYLAKLNCRSIGRYGGWKYSFGEEDILAGKKTAESVAQI